jgi:signal transduction histidine kinase
MIRNWKTDSSPQRLRTRALRIGPAGTAALAGALALLAPVLGPALRGPAGPRANGGARAGELASWQEALPFGGAGALGAAGLGGVSLLLWRVRRRVRGMGPIGQALRAAHAGQSAGSALAVRNGLGPEADAWNRLVGELDRLRKQVRLERAKEALAACPVGAGDLPAACDAMPQGLILFDHAGQTRYANGAAALFLQTRPDQAVGRPIAELPGDPEAIQWIRAAVEAPAPRSRSVALHRAARGEGMFRLSAIPLAEGHSAATMVLVEDVTQQHAASEARNTFLANATHELRTPLMNILLYVETAMEDGEDNPVVRAQALNVINQEARRLGEMVSDILSVSEIEAGAVELQEDDVRLDALFGELQDDYEGAAADKGIALTFDLPPKLPVIQGDRDKIASALHNLLGNALKYTPTGGQVSVRVEVEPERLLVEVADTGLGISETDAQRIFEKFYRADDPRVAEITGSGLGLALAREMIRLHGGDITVESELDQGSRFALTLPLRGEVI